MKPQNYEIIQEYLEDVKNSLLHIVPNNKEFLCALEQDLFDYVTSHPDCSKASLVNEFGSPEFIAMQQIDTLEKKDITKALNNRKRTIAALVILIFLVIIGGYYICQISYFTEGTGTLTLEVEDSGYIDDSVFDEKE